MRTRKAKPGVTRPEVRDMTMYSVHYYHSIVYRELRLQDMRERAQERRSLESEEQRYIYVMYICTVYFRFAVIS